MKSEKTTNRQIYINLAVRDLKRSMEFFRGLGFEFNPQFTDDNAACMIINEDAYVMLLKNEFFAGFTKREICDTKRQSEAMIAFSCPSRAAVTEVVEKAVAAGGSHAVDPIDHGSMFGWSFYDLDGHHWEPMWMDESALQ